MRTVNHFVNGNHWIGDSERFGEVYNPATGSMIAKVRLASTDDVNLVVDLASKAQIGWGATSIAESRYSCRWRIPNTVPGSIR